MSVSSDNDHVVSHSTPNEVSMEPVVILHVKRLLCRLVGRHRTGHNCLTFATQLRRSRPLAT